MILLVLYPAITWYTCARLRRTLAGYVALVVLAVPVPALSVWLNVVPGSFEALSISQGLWNSLVLGYTGMVLAMGVLIVVQKRGPSRDRCLKCRYDLHGMTGEVCPECGKRVHTDVRARLERDHKAR